MTYGLQPPPFREADPVKSGWFSRIHDWAQANTKGVSATSAYTVAWDASIVRANATSGAFTVTLPPITDANNNPVNIGRTIAVVKSDSSSNIVTVTASGTDLINGKASVALQSQWSVVVLKASGSGVWDRMTKGGIDLLSILDFGGIGNGTADDTAAIVAAAATGRTVFFPKGTYRVTSTTVLSTATFFLDRGAMISVDNARTLTFPGYLIADRSQHFTGAGTVLLTGIGEIEVTWFGADPTATNDSTTAIQKALTCAQNSGRLANVVLGVGIFLYSSQITTLTGSGVSIIGVPEAALQQGLIRPTSTLRWTGGASKTIQLNCTFMSFRHISFENTGTATDLFELTTTGSGHFTMHRCSVHSGSSDGLPPDTKPYSASVISGHRPNYSEVSYCEFAGAAPKIWAMDGSGESNGITTLYWFRNHVTSHFDQTSIYVKNSSYDVVTVEKCTYDMQATGDYWSGLGYSYAGVGNEIIDSTDCNDDALGKDFSNVVIKELEWDCDNLTLSTARLGRLHRCRSVKIEDIQITGASDQVAGFDLTEGTVVKSDNVRFINLDDLFDPDETSRAWDGTSNPRTQGAGVVPDDSTSGIIVLEEDSGNVDILPHYGHKLKDTTYQYTDEDGGTNLTVRYLDRTSSPASFATRGQEITVLFFNDSGTDMGTITFNSSFLLHGPFIPPADGMRRSITFEWRGEFWEEKSRTHFDVGASTNKLIDCGTYTPSGTASTNCAATTPAVAQWLRVGNMVTVSGRVNIDPTAAATQTIVRLSLPIGSDLAGADCVGCVTHANNEGYGVIVGDAANNTANIQVVPTGDANTTFSYHYTYQIL